jgi:two-component system C4-dicarboxylate transport response regulator DctD
MNPAILVVDDNDDNRFTLSTRLQICGYSSIVLAADGQTALDRMRAEPIDVVLLDMLMPGLDGYAVLKTMKNEASLRDIPVVMVSAIDDPSSAAKCMDLGAIDYLTKPFNPGLLKARVDSCVELTRHRDRRLEKLESMLIGKSSAISSLRRRLLHIAATNVPVLINGETGAGKEVVAQCLHSFSSRNSKVISAVNCAAIPESMFESEFFGHEAGAYTGARERRIGRFEYADGGTLLLDEIEAMPLSLQTKLLRVLQDQTLQRLGSNKLLKVDVRVLAASKVDLYKASQSGRFREDLYFRLNVAELNIPPLRSRRDDIPILFLSFVRDAAKRYQIPMRHPTDLEMDELASRDWPGNVRELRTAAERFVLRLDAIDSFSQWQDAGSPLTLSDQVAAFERRAIESALRQHRGEISTVMAALDLPRRTLYHKMHRYGLMREDFLGIDQDDEE